ncbi:MAG: hypothetical protein JW959_01530 [Pirellulales bacterium]|nr:hypothetical protein [Pirellulales bacterium]
MQLPEGDATRPIVVSGRAGNRWRLGAYDVWVLRGDCSIQQGRSSTHCREAVLWIDRAEAGERRPHKVIAYLEGDVKMEAVSRSGAARLTDQTWFGRFYSFAGVEVSATATTGRPDELPPIYWRGMERREPEPQGEIQLAQYAENAAQPPSAVIDPPGQPGAAVPPNNIEAAGPQDNFGAAAITLPGGVRRVRVFPRSNVPVQVKWFPDPSGTQWIGVIHSGVNVIVDTEVSVPVIGEVGTIDFSTDRLVIWTAGEQAPPDIGEARQVERVPLEFYMEGNIVFRQGERVIQAERMYYDVTNRTGTIIDAEMLTPVEKYQGLLRLHAEVIQQVSPTRFFVQNAFMTSSRMGEPRYRLQAGEMYFEDTERAVVDPLTGQPVLNPETNQPAVDHERLATASHNLIYLGPVPVFYWPRLATDLNDPTYYIRRARLKQDNVYGTQVLTNWSGYELLGIRQPPEGTDLDVELDYLGERGFGHGGSFEYNREGVFGIGGQTAGLADYWGIQDHGRDDLGQGRMNLVPEKSYRHRLFWQHRHMLPYDLRLSAEVGWISDRNFLEEYFKREWETLKDQTTGVELKQITENRDWSVFAEYRINDFFTQTNWLPRADHYWLGQSLLNDAFTWHEHSQIAYAEFRRLDPPTNANDQPFSYLPWEAASRQGERFATRHEIDWPFQLGAIKVVPYAMGEFAHWGEDVNGQPLDRLWGQVGARASVPFWSVDPTAHNDLLNVYGLAHKIVFDMEFSYSDADRDISQLVLYDPLDDDSIEAYERRFVTTTFGWPSTIPPTVSSIPQRFDPRYYALRSGLQNWVASPSTEIADDLMVFRLGARQRWQTKRGPPHNRRIIDWVTLDTNLSIFPEPGRDDYGQTFGLADYDFNWHVGDRLTLVSDGIFDFFNQGQQIVTMGGFLNRPPRGSLYAGFRVLEGPIHGKILALSYSYWMSPKWVSSFGTSIDLGKQGNLGQNFHITRVGESFLISAGFNVDRSRDSVGVALAIEPRFLPKSRLGRIGGAQIPPAGAFGLE